MEKGNSKTWAVTLTPHRSLGRRGYLIIIGAIALINFVTGLAFSLLGAWPAAGFLGLDVALVWWAFRANFADGRRSERIEVTPHELILERHAQGQDTQVNRFVRRWLRVELEVDRERDLIGGLYLSSLGMRTEIARFLSPHERKELAAALRSALASPHI
ncbi:MAG: DUF2244 domain-containing protein [Rhizobiales bacterium]|nr:DUF2244 domain-containing protein [Hyphomicrobiales bacterium]